MSNNTTTTTSSAGCLGFVISFIISYAMNGGFWWAVLHGFFSWFYIIYAVVWRTKEIVPALVKMFT